MKVCAATKNGEPLVMAALGKGMPGAAYGRAVEHLRPKPRESKCRRLVLSLAWAAALSGCAARNPRVNGKPESTVTDSGHIDLKPGWRLCVITPLLKSGGFRLRTSIAESGDHTLIASREDFLGYETAYYSV